METAMTSVPEYTIHVWEDGLVWTLWQATESNRNVALFGDVLANYKNDPSGYGEEQFYQDFAVGFIGDLAGGGLGILLQNMVRKP